MSLTPGECLTVYFRELRARDEEFVELTYEAGFFARKLAAAVAVGAGEVTERHATIFTGTGVLVLFLTN